MGATSRSRSSRAGTSERTSAQLGFGLSERPYLDPDLIEKLRKKVAEGGLIFQTMLKVIVREHVAE